MPIKTIIFDAYGTLFDVDSAARRIAAEPNSYLSTEVWPALSRDWRDRQLQYSWLRSLTGEHADFWQLTQDALDWALDHQGLSGQPELRSQLLALYRGLSAYPEVQNTLASLKAQGYETAILSNGSPEMLADAVHGAGLFNLLDDVLSAESVGIFKPSSKVYDIPVSLFGRPANEMLFVSSNGWDIAGAASYGFHTVWINRAGLPIERLPGRPDAVVTSLSALPDILTFADPTPARYFTTRDGLRLAYRDSGGDGPALLCLPGLTRNMDDFRTVAARFADDARIIRLDLRGRGLSDHAPDHHSYSIEDETRDALELLDHLRIPSAAILGTSRGGLIALHIAELAPERLTGVFFNDIGPEIETKGLAEIAAYIGRDPGLKSHEEAAAALPAMMAPAFKDVPNEDWKAFSHSLWQQGPDGLTIRYDPRLADAFADQARSIPEQATAWDEFDALAGKPVAVLRGANSSILSRDTLTEMHRRRQDLLVAEVPDRGHVPFLNEPQSENLLRDFIERLT